MKKVIRLTEGDLSRIIKRVISEMEINELGHGDFGDIRELGCVDSMDGLYVGISKVNVESRYGSGIKFLVSYYYDGDERVIYGYGPRIESGMSKNICEIGARYLREMYKEYKS